MVATAAVCTAASLYGASAASASTVITHSTNFAGYRASVSGTATTFSGTMSIPTVTCPASGNETLSPQVDLSSSGNYFSFADMVGCNAGVANPPSFYAIIYSQATGSSSSVSLATKPGDVVRMQLAISPSGIATMKISDANSASSGSISAPASSPLTSIGAGTSVYSQATPTVVPSFTPPVAFGSLKVGGVSLTTLSPTEFEMYNGSTLQVSTSTLTTGGSFKNTFVHS